MYTRLRELVLPRMLGFKLHESECITLRGHMVQKAYGQELLRSASFTAQKRGRFIVAMVGLVGSGKSAVARELGERTNAVVVNSDDIRTELRKLGGSFEDARLITENLARQFIDTGRNVILDSDFIDPYKRASIREKARRMGVPVYFVRTFCDIDIVTDRVVRAVYPQEGFWVGASSPVMGSPQDIGIAVKMREMWRRTPLHYRWSRQGGGQWKLRRLPFKTIADINTGVESERAEGMDVAAIGINYLARTS